MAVGLERLSKHAYELLMRGKVDESINVFKKVLRLVPADGFANNQIGTIYLITGNVEKAIKHFEIAVYTNPTNYSFWINLIVAVDKSGDIARSERLYNDAISKLPKQAELITNSINSIPHISARNMRMLYEQGNYDASEIAARLFIKQFPHNQDGYILLNEIELARSIIND